MTDALEPPSEIKLFPIRGCILPPGDYLPLNVFEPRYLNMVDDALASDQYLAMIQPDGGGTPDRPSLSGVGTAGRIVNHTETDDGRYLIVLEGVMRFQLTEEVDRQTPYRVARADYRAFSNDLMDPSADLETPRAPFMARLKAYFERVGLEADWSSLDEAPLGLIVNKTAMAAPFGPSDKQALLEAATLNARAQVLDTLMQAALTTPRDPS